MPEPVSPAPENRVPIIGPDGQPYTVPEVELPEALSKGARVEKPEEAAHRQALRNAAQASALPTFAGSVAESLPFVGGGAAKAVRAVAGKTPEQAEAEAEMHPIARIGGTVAGAAAQAAAVAATGGLEGAAEGAGLLGEGGTEAMGLLGRTAVKAGAGAVEGALYTTGGAVNEAVLNNHPLTAEMLLSHAAGGALFGGVLAGGLSLAGEGLEGMAEHAEKVGNEARASKVGGLVGAEAKQLEEAGVTTPVISRGFKEGWLSHSDKTPVELQTRVTAKLAETEQALAEIGAKIDSSGQTVDLAAAVKAAAKSPAETALQKSIMPGDEAANFGRAQAFRMLAEKEGASKVSAAIDTALAEKAGAISSKLADSLEETLSNRADLSALRRFADGAVAAGHMPEGAGGMFENFGQTVRHLGAIGTVARMAAGVHPGAGMLALGAGNLLGRVMRGSSVAETVLGGLKGVAKATNLTQEQLNTAVLAAVEGAHHAVGHIAEVAHGALLKRDATDADVQTIREALAKAEQHKVPNGHPDIDAAVTKQRMILAQALPPPQGNPNTPKALARPNLGPTGKQIDSYNSTLRVLSDPIGTVGRIGKGKATGAEIHTLAQAYPELSKRAGQQMLNTAADRGKPVPAATKRAIEILHGTAFDPATTPAKIGRIQVAAFGPEKPKTAGDGGGSPRAKGLDKLDIGDRISAGMMTSADRARGKR